MRIGIEFVRKMAAYFERLRASPDPDFALAVTRRWEQAIATGDPGARRELRDLHTEMTTMDGGCAFYELTLGLGCWLDGKDL